MQQLEVFLVDRHVLTEGDRRGLRAADEMHPAPRLTGRVVLLDDRLVVIEGVHLSEIVVPDDLCETRDEGLRVVPAFTYCVAKLTVSLTSGTARLTPRLVTLDQSVGGWV